MNIEQHWQEYKSDLQAEGFCDLEKYKRIFFSGAAVAITEIVPHLESDPAAVKLKINELVKEIYTDMERAEAEDSTQH